MEWFRYKTRTIECRKVQALPAPLFKAWVNLLCIASIYDGILPAVPEIAFRLRCSEDRAAEWIASLKESHLIDCNGDGSFSMHDWNEHQYVSDNVTERVRKHRAKRAGNVSVTPPDTEQIQNRTETDSDAEKTFALAPSDAGVVRPPVPTFEDFWRVWWNKTAKADAQKAWPAAAHSHGAAFLIEQTISDRARFEPTEDWSWRAKLHPATWLRGRRWEDQTPIAVPKKNGHIPQYTPEVVPAETPQQRREALEWIRDNDADPQARANAAKQLEATE